MDSIYDAKGENYEDANFSADLHNIPIMTTYILPQILLYAVLCHVHM